MISYLIKSGLCLAILLAFYHLVLEREKMHQFNRFYLLGSVLFSFLVPFVIIYVDPAPIVESSNATKILLSKSNLATPADETIIESSSISLSQWILYAYLFISSFLIIRFFKNLIDIVIKIKTNEVIGYDKAKLVLVDDEILPHTFWNYIFINREEYLSKKVEKELFTHELTHVTQKHTLDVLIVETLQIVLWFNPFFYPLKKAIQLNHEFLADDKVIASHQDISKYQYLLLDKAAWKNKYYLASNLNYSLTKKRLLMMKTKNSKSTIRWKKLAIIPLVGGLIFLFADRVEAQSTKKKPVIKEVKIEGASDAQMKTYTTLFNDGKKTNIYKLRDVKKMRDIYKTMTDQQKKSVTNIDEVLPPPPPPRKIRIEEIKKEKLPPPPQPKKKKTKEIKEIKIKKSPKVAKKIKEAKEKKELKEEIEIVEEAEVLEKMEIIEVPEEVEEEEIEIKEEKEWKTEFVEGEKVEGEIIIEEAEAEVSNFKILVQKDGSKISMTCKRGCAWKDLTFTLKKNKTQAINKYGMTSIQKKSDSDFLFLITNNKNSLSLKGLKGTAWKDSNFSIKKNETVVIDAF